MKRNGGVAAPINKMPRSLLNGRRRGGRFNHRLSEVEPTISSLFRPVGLTLFTAARCRACASPAPLMPGRASKERDHLFDGAATPPFQGGESPYSKFFTAPMTAPTALTLSSQAGCLRCAYR